MVQVAAKYCPLRENCSENGLRPNTLKLCSMLAPVASMWYMRTRSWSAGVTLYAPTANIVLLGCMEQRPKANSDVSLCMTSLLSTASTNSFFSQPQLTTMSCTNVMSRARGSRGKCVYRYAGRGRQGAGQVAVAKVQGIHVPHATKITGPHITRSISPRKNMRSQPF